MKKDAYKAIWAEKTLHIRWNNQWGFYSNMDEDSIPLGYDPEEQSPGKITVNLIIIMMMMKLKE